MSKAKQTNLSTFFGVETSSANLKRKHAADASECIESNTPSTSKSSDTMPSEPDLKKKTKSVLRKFNAEWSNEFKWLRFEEEGDKIIIICQIFEAAKKSNGFTKGCINLKKSALKDHRDSASHHQAVTTMYHKNAMAAHMEVAADKSDEKLTAMLNTVLFMSQENIATSKFSKLIELQQRNGCEHLQGETYTHSDSIDAMENALVESTKENLKSKLEKSKFIGLIIDETVNITVEKKLILFVKIVNDGKAETVFLGNFSVHSGTAECIMEKILEILPQWNIPLEKVVGLGSDGASVMTRKHSGVGKRLQDHNSYLVHVHCIAHRVTLASADAAKISKVVAEYRRTLNDIYKLFEYSATRYNRLRELSEVLEDSDFSSLKQPCSVRWLSVGRAVKAVKSNWPALVLEIEDESAERNNAVATNIQKKIRTYSLIRLTYMMTDVLHVMDKIVTLFQRENINLGMIMPIVNSTIDSLASLENTAGENEQHFLDNLNNGEFRGIQVTYGDPRSIGAFVKTRCGFIEELCNSLRKRFPDDSLDIVACLDKVLNPSRFPQTQEELTAHGRESLEKLLDKFCLPIGPAENDVINCTRAQQDFTPFKMAVNNIGADSLEQSCKTVISELSDIYPDFSTLCSIALAIPVSSVDAERGFSLQNRIHSASRNCLSQQRINNLMLLNLHADVNNTVKQATKIFRRKKRKL